jgi:hypothetical protein
MNGFCDLGLVFHLLGGGGVCFFGVSFSSGVLGMMAGCVLILICSCGKRELEDDPAGP